MTIHDIPTILFIATGLWACSVCLIETARYALRLALNLDKDNPGH